MKREGALKQRFVRHSGIYRSDVSSHLFNPGPCPAFRTGRRQVMFFGLLLFLEWHILPAVALMIAAARRKSWRD
jgi:hypothetical protein